MRTWLGFAVGFVLQIVCVSAVTLYVYPLSANPTPPYATWGTAATTIQDAVDVAPSGAVVLVTNGIYRGGVVIQKPLALLSVNGPLFTTIDGGGSNRCLSASLSETVSGFTLTNGVADNGGGVWCGSSNVYL